MSPLFDARHLIVENPGNCRLVLTFLECSPTIILAGPHVRCRTSLASNSPISRRSRLVRAQNLEEHGGLRRHTQ